MDWFKKIKVKKRNNTLVDFNKEEIFSFDINPDDHLKIQAAFQKYTDNSVSKTVNLPENSTFEDIKNIYLKAFKLKCKGITIYRYGSKDNQVLSFENKNTMSEIRNNYNIDKTSYFEVCIRDNCLF